MSGLSDAERKALTKAFAGSSRSPEHLAFLAAPAVEAIVAPYRDALARVEALAAEWEVPRGEIRTGPRGDCRVLAARHLRAALRSDAHTEQAPAPKITDADLAAALKEYGKTPEGKAWLASLDLPPRLPELYGDAHTEQEGAGE